MTEQTESKAEETQKEKKENALVNLSVNIVIPTVIMMKFSRPEYLGQIYGLIIALAFPIVYGLYDLYNRSKVNFFSLLGLFSILITGGIGLLELNKKWMIVKETAIPFIMGMAIIISQKTKMPLVRTFLNQMIELDKVAEAFREKGVIEKFEKNLNLSSYLLAITFFISAVLNFVLATMILKGQPGSTEFVESLGKMTLYSFPVITVPMMIMLVLILYILIKGIKDNTSLEVESIFRQ
jgi:hypothetical protein